MSDSEPRDAASRNPTEAEIDALEQVYGLESTSFVRYLVANSEIQVEGDFDRKARSFLVDWYRASDLNRSAFVDLLGDMGVVPAEYSYPLRFSEYHYLSAAYLLGPVVRYMKRSLGDMRARLAELEGWPRAHDLVAAVIEREGAIPPAC